VPRFKEVIRPAWNERKMIISAIIAGAVIWGGDAFFSSLIFHKQSFLGALIYDVGAFEIYIRTVWLACFISGVVLARALIKHKQAEEEAREHKETLRSITEAAKDAIVIIDHRGNISFWNQAATDMFGYADAEVIGKELHAFLDPQKYYKTYKEGFKYFKGTRYGAAIGKTLELNAVRKNGTEFPVELSLSAIQIKDGWHAAGVIRDITERKKIQEEIRKHREELAGLVEERTAELKEANEHLHREIINRKHAEGEVVRSERFLNMIFESIHDPFSIIDSDYTIVKANEPYAQMRHKLVKDIIGKKCHEVLQNRETICDECVVEKTFQSGGPCAKDKMLALPDGKAWMAIYTHPIFGYDGRVSHVIEYTRDITDRKMAEEEKEKMIGDLEHLSRTDSLTGLLNRRALIERLDYEVDRAKRYGAELSIILCDMDNFKEINDTYGHAAGDKVLQVVSETVCSALRTTDVVGRYGGDEFMVILPETILEGAKNLADRVFSSVKEAEVQVNGTKTIKLSLSLGVTCFNAAKEDEDRDVLIRRADIALYTSKKDGGNKVNAIEA